MTTSRLYGSKIFLKMPKYFIKLSLHLQLVCDETQNSAPRVRNDRINDDRYSGRYAEDERQTSRLAATTKDQAPTNVNQHACNAQLRGYNKESIKE